MNEHKPTLDQLRCILDSLKKIDLAARSRGNELVLVTEGLEDTIPDAQLPWEST